MVYTKSETSYTGWVINPCTAIYSLAAKDTCLYPMLILTAYHKTNVVKINFTDIEVSNLVLLSCLLVVE